MSQEITPNAVVRNTTDSHRVLERAFGTGGTNSQRRLLELIYAGHFERGEDIGDHEFLASSAVTAGLFPDVEAGKAWLKGDEEVEAVDAACKKAQAIGITGVPFLIVDGKYAISGAQDPETLHKVRPVRLLASRPRSSLLQMLRRVITEKSELSAPDPGRGQAQPV